MITYPSAALHLRSIMIDRITNRRVKVHFATVAPTETIRRAAWKAIHINTGEIRSLILAIRLMDQASSAK